MEQADLERALAHSQDACARLTDSWKQTALAWEWDARFGAALVAVRVPDDSLLLQRLQTTLTHQWDHKRIRSAPEHVVALANDWGGLRPGQLFFALDPQADPLLFAAWWPWGGGKTFSLRVACRARSEPAEAADPEQNLRRWFSV